MGCVAERCLHPLSLLPPLPLLSCSVAAGLVLGAVMLLVVRPPAGLRKHVMVATALGNAGNLPLVLVAALIRETGGRLFAGEVSQQLLLTCVKSKDAKHVCVRRWQDSHRHLVAAFVSLLVKGCFSGGVESAAAARSAPS